jgi:hypothetical protein
MPSLDQIRDSIAARISELTNEIATLEAARAALRGPSPVRTPPATSSQRVVKPKRRRTAKPVPIVSDPRRAARAASAGNGANGSAGAAGEARAGSADQTPKRRSRARAKPAKAGKPVEALLAEKLETMLGEAQDGLSAITISKRSNAGYNRVLTLLRELEGAGQVRRTGSRRTSLWRLITDEDRIAERAAELKRLATSKS